jgi:predicted enzyme related to lactoylglutathione lyase
MSRKISWIEHHSADSEASSAFYGKLLDVETQPTDMGDHNDYTAMNGDAHSFGLIQSFKGLDGYTGWLLFFTVDELAGEKVKALEMGATAVLEDPGGEHYGPWCAMKDPQGVMFVLFQE